MFFSLRRLFAVAIFFLPVFFSAQSNTQSIENFISNVPIKAKLIKQELAQTGGDKFPSNFFIDFEQNTKNDGAGRKTLVLSFLQEDVFLRQDEFADLLLRIENAQKNCRVRVLFTALDSTILPKPFWHGSAVFATKIDDEEDVFVLSISFREDSLSCLLTGCFGSASPLWLTKFCADSFSSSQIPFEMPNKILSLYRLGVLKGDERMSAFIHAKIPAVALELGENWISFILTAVSLYEPKISRSWDTHYFFIPLSSFFRSVWLDEKAFLAMTILVIAFSSFLLCGFSFIGRTASAYKRDFVKSWYLFPFIFATCVFACEFFQRVFPKIVLSVEFLQNLPPLFLIGAKISVAILFVQLIFGIMERLHFSVVAFVYGYFCSIIAIFSILVFSAVDLLYFVAFAFEFLIIFLFRPARRTIFMIFAILFLLVPFFPYALEMALLADDFMLEKIAFCSIWGNVALALTLFPIQIFWQRVLVRLKIRFGRYGLKSVFSSMILIFFAILISTFPILISYFFQKKVRIRHVEQKPILMEEIKENDKNSLSAKISKTDFHGLSTNHIKIQAENALRIEVELNSPASAPLYESTYSYELTGNGEARFLLPDNPPSAVSIDYACASSQKSTVKIKAYFFDDDDFRFEERVLFVGNEK